jgi:phage-related protein
MYLNSDYFTFNGINSREMELEIISLEADRQSPFGIKRSVDEEKFMNNLPIVYGINDEQIVDQQIQLTRVDKNGIPKPLDKEYRIKIINWLFKNEYMPIEFEQNKGLVYYVIFTDGNRMEYCNEQGYLTCTLKFMTPYAYTKTEVYSKGIYGLSGRLTEDYVINNNIILENSSNAVDKIYPYIEIEKLNDLDGVGHDFPHIEIVHKNTGNKMSIWQMAEGECIKIYTDIKIIKSSNSDFKFNYFNRKWLYLNKGVNIFEVNSYSNFKITVKYQTPMAL